MAQATERVKLALVPVLAIALPSLAFWLAVFPAPLRVLSFKVAVAVFRLLDAPTSALNALLPWSWRSGVAVQFTEAPLTFGWPGFRGYLLVGFTAYLVLGFGLRYLYRRVARKSRGQQVAVDGGA